MKNVIAALFCILFASMAYGQTYDQWIAGTPGSWSFGPNWSLASSPNSTDSALISAPTNCSVSANSECENLILENGSNGLTVGGVGASLVVDDTAYIGGQPGFTGGDGYLNIENGEVDISDLELGTSTYYGQVGMIGGTLNVETLTVGSRAVVNLDGGAIYIYYGTGPDPIAHIRTLLKNSYVNKWAVTLGEICSDYANTNHFNYKIGYADAADPGNPAGLPPGTIKIMTTLDGDANLDGKVDGDDYTIIVSHLNQAVGGWDAGDFEYSGVCNGDDYTSVVTHLGQTSALPTN